MKREEALKNKLAALKERGIPVPGEQGKARESSTPDPKEE